MHNSFSNIQVANKIEDFRIVINKGEKDNIESYMRFLVYEDGPEILDPSTKKNLGKLEIPKGFFKVQHIQDNITILVSELRKEKNIYQIVRTDINVEEDLLRKIKIGDKVKIVNKL